MPQLFKTEMCKGQAGTLLWSPGSGGQLTMYLVCDFALTDKKLALVQDASIKTQDFRKQ